VHARAGEKDQIYGSVQIQEIADAIYQQTGRNVSDSEISVPEIKAVGTYECTIRLHPEVGGTLGCDSSYQSPGVVQL
jgi:large subunit ribosomal protein L9